MAQTTRNRRFGRKNIGESHTISSGIGVLFEPSADAIDFRSSRYRDVMFYQSKLLYHGRPERAWRGYSINIDGENDRSVPVVLVFCNFVFCIYQRWALLCDIRRVYDYMWASLRRRAETCSENRIYIIYVICIDDLTTCNVRGVPLPTTRAPKDSTESTHEKRLKRPYHHSEKMGLGAAAAKASSSVS